MKFQLDNTFDGNAVQHVRAGELVIRGQRHTQPVLVPFQGDVVAWHGQSVDDLDEAFFTQLAAQQPELVLVGSGSQLKLVHPRLTRALYERGIGVDAMDTHAACRTFNILISEGRKAWALLIPPAA